LRDERVQLLPAGRGQREDALVRPASLLDDAPFDQCVLLEPVELAVQLLRCRRPEVADRDVEALGQLVAGRLTFQERREYGVTQSHLDTSGSAP
jgi:hypothetical protein